MNTAVRIAIATHRRPDRLHLAIASLARAAARAPAGYDIGVVVIDDDPAGSAAPVARSFGGVFSLGCDYVECGSQNISRARNMGLEAALPHSDWVGSIDDDVVVPESWFATCAAALSLGADAVTGPLLKDFSNGAAWLTREPFDQLGLMRGVEGERASVCATGNNWIASGFLRDRPWLRFDPALGVVGGEDMDFFRRAIAAGLVPVYSRKAAVVEAEPPSRCTLRYQVRRAFWLGLSEAQIGLRHDRVSRSRLVARAGRRAVNRGARRVDPELIKNRGIRFTLAIYAESVGVVLGSLGVRMRHS